MALVGVLFPASTIAQSGQSQENRNGNAIQIGTARDVNISIAPSASAIPLPAKDTKAIPAQVAAEAIWRALLRLGKLNKQPSDKEIHNILPKFAQPEDKDDEQRIADEYRDLWPQLRNLALLPNVQNWKQIGTTPLDNKGSTRITFQGILQPSPYAYNQSRQLLPPPWVQLLIDINPDGVPKGFNLKGYTPYGN